MKKRCLFAAILVLLVCLAFGAFASASGWKKEGSYLYYYMDGVRATGTITLDGEEYSFTDDGILRSNGQVRKIDYAYYVYVGSGNKLASGWTTVGEDTYYFDPETGRAFIYDYSSGVVDGIRYVFGWDGKLMKNQWCSDMYGSSDGSALTGYQTIEGKRYLFSDTGIVQTGFQEIDGETHYFFDAWYSEEDYEALGWTVISGSLYYFDPDTGVMQTGNRPIDGTAFTFGTDGVFSHSGPVVLQSGDGKWYGYSADNERLSGWQTIDGARYYFAYYDAYTGPQELYEDGEWNWYYFDSKGKMQSNLLIRHRRYSENETEFLYYYGSDGKRVNGWATIGGARYYFDSYSGASTGPCNLYENNEWSYYYFDDEGRLQTDLLIWLENNGDEGKALYYYGSDGKRVTGWKTVGEAKYYFTYSGAYTGVHQISENDEWNWYYFDSDGKLQTNLLIRHKGYWSETESLYYYGADGKRVSGWMTIGGEKYYFDEYSGACTGEKYIEDDCYYFDPDGKMQTGLIRTKQSGEEGKDRLCYYGPDGKRVTGWMTIGGEKYYFNDAACTGPLQLYENEEYVYYYFDDEGRMQTDLLIWHRTDSWSDTEGLYYYGADGKRVSGWMELDGSKYYFDRWSGAYTGAHDIYWDDGWGRFYFDPEGKLLNDEQENTITVPESMTVIGANAFEYFNGTIIFKGPAPEFDPEAFLEATVIVVYPHDQPGWDGKPGNSYGARWIRWRADNADSAGEAGPKDPTEELTRESYSNLYNHDYVWNWASKVRSYMIPEKGSAFTLVDYNGSKVVIEEYSKEKELIWKKTLTPELPLWGGFYAGEDYNFFVYGQYNDEEDDAKEVVRVVRYDKNWNRIDSASVSGYDITAPFEAGTLDMDQGGDYLYIHTSRQMYTHTDGLRHQSNLTYKLYIPDMVFTYDNPSSPVYVSHSFNQVVYEDEGDIIMVDHGDAYPRGVIIRRMENDTEAPGFVYGSSVMLFTIPGDIGENYTGVTVGGSAATETRYVVAGKSIDLEKFGKTDRENIYVASVSKEDFSEDSVRFRWQTQLQENNTVELANPFLIALTRDRLLLLWGETGFYRSSDDTLRYVFLDENGEEATEVYSMKGWLSDVEPVVSGNAVNWYVRTGSNIEFYSLDLSVAGLDLTGATQKITDFVRRCYTLILGRDADEGGLNNWVNQLKAKVMNASEIISGFMNSQEYLNQNNSSDQTVEVLYNTMLDRGSDPMGKAGWVDTLNASGNSNTVINGFCGSQEFLAICDDYGIIAGSVPMDGTLTGIKGFVARCYKEALSRTSDEGGLQYWCSILENREQTPQQVAAGFVYSDEMNATGKIIEDPDALLDSLYRLYLGREADEAGKEYWKQRIAEGLTLDELNYGFAYSAEFSGIVESYGLN